MLTRLIWDKIFESAHLPEIKNFVIKVFQAKKWRYPKFRTSLNHTKNREEGSLVDFEFLLNWKEVENKNWIDWYFWKKCNYLHRIFLFVTFYSRVRRHQIRKRVEKHDERHYSKVCKVWEGEISQIPYHSLYDLHQFCLVQSIIFKRHSVK